MVDDLLNLIKEPGLIVKSLQEIWGYELKGVGDPEYYSGAVSNMMKIENA